MKMIFEKKILNMYRGMMYTRCDDTETVFYFSADDFPGLFAEPYPFTAAAGHTLQGYLYAYENPIKGRLLVFDHGFGGGHRAYMKEIEMLCRHGYRVLAYDHTGCMESGGDNPNGLAQSLCDLNDCLMAVKADARFAGLGIAVMGHSWGAFSTLNITALHPDVTHIVAMCGFVSVEEMVNGFFSGLLRGYRKAVLALEQSTNPYFSTFDAAKTLAASNAKALLIYSADDRLCRRKHYDILNAALAARENIDFLFVEGKGHNPNYTADAVLHLGEYLKKLETLDKKKLLETKAQKKEFLASFDWHRMTEQDPAVWQEIFRTLDS